MGNFRLDLQGRGSQYSLSCKHVVCWSRWERGREVWGAEGRRGVCVCKREQASGCVSKGE